MPQGEAQAGDELSRLRARVGEPEAGAAALRRTNDGLLAERQLAEEQAARLAQSATAQRGVTQELARELEQARRRADDIHRAARQTEQTLTLVLGSAPHGIVMV